MQNYGELPHMMYTFLTLWAKRHSTRIIVSSPDEVHPVLENERSFWPFSKAQTSFVPERGGELDILSNAMEYNYYGE